MKLKVLLTATILLAAWSIVQAGDGPLVGTPRGGPQALASADYGGVWYSTFAFGFSGTGGAVNFSTVVIPTNLDRKTAITGVFYGVIFSSGLAGQYDFVDVFDSTSSDRALKEGAIMRLYNVAGSTNTSFANASAASGFSGPPKPVRFLKGLLIRASVPTYNSITTLYYREP